MHFFCNLIPCTQREKGSFMDYKDYQSGATQEHFWFKAKSQLIHTLMKEGEQSSSLKILNVGVGTGDDVPILAQFGAVYVLDIDQKALDLVDGSYVMEKRQADACQLPYSDETFDIVVSFDVMEHVEHDQKMINEIHRVLKNNGTYIFTVPAYNWLYSAHDRVLNHYRRYNRKMIHALFSKFEKIRLGNWVFFLFLPAVVKRLLNKKSLESEVPMLPALLNRICYKILVFENWCIRSGINLPFGLTLYGIYKKT